MKVLSRVTGSHKWSTSTRTCSWRSSLARALTAAPTVCIGLSQPSGPSTGTSAACMEWGASGWVRRCGCPEAESPTSARAWALASMGDLARKQGAVAEARACFEESLALCAGMQRCPWHHLGTLWARVAEPSRTILARHMPTSMRRSPWPASARSRRADWGGLEAIARSSHSNGVIWRRRACIVGGGACHRSHSG